MTNETTNTTKDGIIVAAGQVWKDLDKRMPDRYCRVEFLSEGKAIMFLCTEHGRILNAARKITVSIRRMHKSSSGWELVKNE